MQKEQLEAAALQEELNQNQADLEAIHKILSSPFVQRDAMREAGGCWLEVLRDCSHYELLCCLPGSGVRELYKLEVRGAWCSAEHEDFKMSASPKRHGTRQPVIKLTASSATSDSPVARALFQLETQGVSPEMHTVFVAAAHSCAPAATTLSQA